MGGGTSLVEGDVGDKLGCKGTRGEKDQLGVVEDVDIVGDREKREFGRYGEFGRKGGIWFVGHIWFGAVGCEGEGTEEGATGEKGVGSVEEGVDRGRKEKRKICWW